MIRLSCPCGRALQVRDDLGGKKIKCVYCARTIDVPAGAPPPPKPSFDVTYGDPTARRLRAELAKGDWRGAAAFLKQTRDWDAREFYVSALAEWKGRPAWLEEWVVEDGESSLPWLVRGTHSMRWAWEARGSGMAENVSEEGRRLFHERIEMAEADLKVAGSMDPDDPTPHAILVLLARGKEWEFEEVKPHFENALRRHPESRTALFGMLYYLCEKWFGSHEDMFEFAHNFSGEAPDGSRAHALVAAAHVERWLFAGSFDGDHEMADAYFMDRQVQDEIQTAYKKSIGNPWSKETLLTVHDRNLFAFCFYVMEKDDLARKELAKIGDRMSEVPWCFLGDPVETFAKAKKELG